MHRIICGCSQCQYYYWLFKVLFHRGQLTFTHCQKTLVWKNDSEGDQVCNQSNKQIKQRS